MNISSKWGGGGGGGGGTIKILLFPLQSELQATDINCKTGEVHNCCSTPISIY